MSGGSATTGPTTGEGVDDIAVATASPLQHSGDLDEDSDHADDEDDLESSRIPHMRLGSSARLRDILSFSSGRALVQTAQPARGNLGKPGRLLDALESEGAIEMAEVLRSLRHAHPDLDLLSEYAPPDAAQTSRFVNERHPRAMPGPDGKPGKPLPVCGTHTGTFPLPCVTPRAGLVRFSAGISAYFRFVKMLGLMWTVLFVLSLPLTLINAIIGDFFRGGFLILGVTTLGNLYVTSAVRNAGRPANVSSAEGAAFYEVSADFLCVAPAPENSSAVCLTDSDELSVFYAGWDVAVALVFLLFAALARRGTAQEKERHRRLVHRVEHYSVAVSQLPADCTREQLRAHFEGLCEGGAVHDVQMVSTTGDELALAVHRGRQIQRLARADAWRRKARPGSVQARAAERLFNKRMRRVLVLDMRVPTTPAPASAGAAGGGDLAGANGIDGGHALPARAATPLRFAALGSSRTLRLLPNLLGKSYRVPSGQPVMAFVTFVRQRDRDLCLRMYDEPTCGLRQPAELRLAGTHELKLSEAPAPAALLWENADVAPSRRRFRILQTFVGLVALLAVHLGLNFLAQPYKLNRKFLDEAVTGIRDADPCGSIFVGIPDDFGAALAAAQAADAPGGGGVAGTSVSAQDCLCEAVFVGALNFADPAGLEDDACAAFQLQRLQAMAVQVLLAVVVLSINLAAYGLMSRAARSMRHASVVARDRTVLRGVFFLAYANTALLLLLLHADLSLTIKNERVRKVLGDGRSKDFGPDWFRQAGFEVLTLALLNVFTPHLLTLGEAAWRAMRRRHGRLCCGLCPGRARADRSQAEEREVSLGPEFLLSFRLAQALFTAFFIMTYSAGLPVLYALGAVSALVTYWVDKFLFLRVCRTPETQSTALQEWANAALPWAVVAHALIGIWMISGPQLLPGQDDPRLGAFADEATFVGEAERSFAKDVLARLSRRSSIPLLLLLGLFLGAQALAALGSRVDRLHRAASHLRRRTVRKCVALCCRCCGRRTANVARVGAVRATRAAWTDPPPLPEAIASGKLLGLTSFFILENERYKRFLPDLNEERAVNDELRANAPGL